MICMVGMLSSPVYADEVEGCDPKVMRNMRDKAMLKVAIDKAVTEEFITMPNSVIFMTCFAQQARNSAETGGGIFSGDFTGSEITNEGLAPVINKQLKAHAANYKEVPEYENGKLTAYYQGNYLDITKASAGGACPALDELWKSVRQGSINKKAPYVSVEDVVTGNIPWINAGHRFKTSLTSPATLELIAQYKISSALLKPITATKNCNNLPNICAVQTCLNNGTKPPGCP
jgi:hypothetical protein